MTQLSGGGVVAAMHMAGFPKSAWRIGAAVAYGESSWNTETVNQEGNTPPSRDLGLFQINDHYHPGEVATGDWSDPVDNAKMAYRIWDQGGPMGDWNSWVVYKEGIYRDHLDKADQAIREHEIAHRSANELDTQGASSVDETLLADNGFSVTPTETGDGSIERLNSAVATLQDSNTWVRVGMVSAGALLVIIGGFWLVRSSSAFQKANSAVTDAVMDVIPVGKITDAISGKGGRRRGAQNSDDG